MEIKMNVDSESPVYRLIREELEKEYKAMKDTAQRKKRVRIKLKPAMKKYAFVEAGYSGKKLRIYTKKLANDMKTGYIQTIPQNVDEIIEKKIQEALKKRSKIKIMLKPKLPILEPQEPTVQEPEAIKEEEPTKPVQTIRKVRITVNRTKNLKPKAALLEPKGVPLEPKGIPLDSKAAHDDTRHVGLRPTSSEKQNFSEIPKSSAFQEHGNPQDFQCIRMRTTHGTVTLNLKSPPKKEPEIKTGMLAGSMQLEPLIQLFSVMMKKSEEEEEVPRVEGVRLPEV